VSNVRDGGDYWAPFGKKRWSAVRVISVTDGEAEVNRVDASSNEPKSRRTKVDASKLVLRDPARVGEDKPEASPSEVFDRAMTPEEEHEARIARIMALLDDDSTVDDW